MALLPHYSRDALRWDNADPERRLCWRRSTPNALEMAWGMRDLGVIETHRYVD